MYNHLTILIIVVVIAVLLLLIVVLLVASVVRRALNNQRYRKLDILRRKYREQVHSFLSQAPVPDRVTDFAADQGSLEWQAVEEVLLDMMNDGVFIDDLRKLFCRLGYVAYYENRLTSRNPLIRSAAIDKLGRMGSQASLPKLIPRLDETESEILTVTVRALGRIGGKEGLAAIADRLPVLLGQGQVTRKAMETALLNFGSDAVSFLVEYRTHDSDPWIMSCVLETLSHLSPDIQVSSMASEHMASTNPEVRSKALKVLGHPAAPLPAGVSESIISLLNDPVWFVRLQAIKSAQRMDDAVTARAIGKLLFDGNWRVRNEAALALTRFGEHALDVFLDALNTDDRYAKESICEEIQKTHFVDRLFEHLDDDKDLRMKSVEILTIMHSLRFSTPLREYLASSGNEQIKKEITKIIALGAAS